jgi:hypothetical protein
LDKFYPVVFAVKSLLYEIKYISGRTIENRIACMDITIKRYYQNLESVKVVEKAL